jgi:hypothetical protein
MENVGEFLLILLAGSGLVGGILSGLLLSVVSHRLELLLESLGHPYDPNAHRGGGIQTRAYQEALFLAWCRQAIPNEPLLKQYLLIAKVQKYGAIAFVVGVALAATGWFRSV